MKMTIDCTHRPTAVAGLAVAACPDCGTVEWSAEGEPLDPAQAMAHLFGDFDLVARLPALAAPGPEVLLYRPPTRRLRQRLEAFPAHSWVEAAPDLWLSHDGRHLLLAPRNRLLLENLTRGA